MYSQSYHPHLYVFLSLEDKKHARQQQIDDAMSALVGIRVLALSSSSHRYHEGGVDMICIDLQDQILYCNLHSIKYSHHFGV
jgi:hypothetical protein